jgi:hypothetical protein
VRAHETLGTTPAVKIGTIDRPLSVAELAKPVEAPPAEEERQEDLFAWAASRPAELLKPLPPVGTQLQLFPGIDQR